MMPDYTDLIGAPFIMYGRSVEKDGGISCQGLMLEMHRRVGHDPVDPLEDSDAAEAQWEVVEGPPQPLDVLGMQVGKTDLAGHVGVMVEDGMVLHATQDAGTVLQPYAGMAHRVLVIYRWRT